VAVQVGLYQIWEEKRVFVNYGLWLVGGVLKIVRVCSLSKLSVSLLRDNLDRMKNRVAWVDTGYKLGVGVWIEEISSLGPPRSAKCELKIKG
jgi:uncharacterized protein YebE (UPF0316 family)